MHVSVAHLVLAVCALLALGASGAQSSQGCPFDDGSCQTYCQQQGCNFGYCGNFAWIQCICRKCGDAWNSYDKVRTDPNKQVNQTELDSLKLNTSSPLILTHTSTSMQQPQQQQKEQEVTTTLTTLLIPDLSSDAKLGDINDIPDENSEKFLDFLAKNHERLAQATSTNSSTDANIEPSSDAAVESTEDSELIDEEQLVMSGGSSSSTTPITTSSSDGDLVEIQISSNDNTTEAQQRRDEPEGNGAMSKLMRAAAAAARAT